MSYTVLKEDIFLKVYLNKVYGIFMREMIITNPRGVSPFDFVQSTFI